MCCVMQLGALGLLLLCLDIDFIDVIKCDKGKIVNYAFDVKLVHVYISEEKWWY